MQVVTLPYPLLLQKSAREALGLSLKDHVVVIDEAHNIMDAISNIHSVIISMSQVRQSRTQIMAYLQKFGKRLKGKNRVYIAQLLRVLDSLLAYLEAQSTGPAPTEGQATTSELLAGKAVDQVNLYKLMHYMQESRFARRVDGYNSAQAESKSLEGNAAQSKRSQRATTPVLMHIQSFLQALTNPAAEGRFFYSKPAASNTSHQEAQFKYLLLDPTPHFREIVDEARAVILAGGTLSPLSDYTNHLFHYLPHERITTLSCGHVIPPANLLAMTVSQGPSGRDFDFSFENRNSSKMLDDLGAALITLADTVPDGLVVFFPSYAMLSTTIQHFQTNPSQRTTWSQLASRKRIFLEPNVNTTSQHSQPHTDHSRETSATVLQSYTAHIAAPKPTSQTNTGALLFAVISGSLSEGINFSDSLGRCVAVVGLPFPSPHSPEWKAKIEFAEKRQHSASFRHTDVANASKHSTPSGVGAGREMTLNATMRAINQSIGRAIRHKNDYAAVVLLDKRYERKEVRERLPRWIGDGLAVGVSCKEGGEGVGARLRRFFKEKRD